MDDRLRVYDDIDVVVVRPEEIMRLDDLPMAEGAGLNGATQDWSRDLIRISSRDHLEPFVHHGR